VLRRDLHGVNSECCVTQNVTYGYTGASFSGRMPCVEIADDIVQTGRETLEKVGAASLSITWSYMTDLDRKLGNPVYRIATSMGSEGKSEIQLSGGKTLADQPVFCRSSMVTLTHYSYCSKAERSLKLFESETRWQSRSPLATHGQSSSSSRR
jgi:hypothetical protein